MKKYLFLLAIITLTTGFITQGCFGANQEVSKEIGPVHFDYYQYLRERLKNNASDLYNLYGKWEDSGEVIASFTVLANGKLDRSSIEFSNDSVGGQRLKNMMVLAIEKTFPAKPFPKLLCQYSKLTFNIPIRFESDYTLIKRKLAPWQIGIYISNINDDIRKIYDIDVKRGIFVIGIYEDSSALAAGLRPGDIIYSANGKPMKTTKHLIKFIKKHRGNITFSTDRGEITVNSQRRGPDLEIRN